MFYNRINSHVLFFLASLCNSELSSCSSSVFLFLRTDFVASGDPIQCKSSSDDTGDEDPSLDSISFLRRLGLWFLLLGGECRGELAAEDLADLAESILFAIFCGFLSFPVSVSILKSSNSFETRRPLLFAYNLPERKQQNNVQVFVIAMTLIDYVILCLHKLYLIGFGPPGLTSLVDACVFNLICLFSKFLLLH